MNKCYKCNGQGFYYDSGEFNNLVCGGPTCQVCKGTGLMDSDYVENLILIVNCLVDGAFDDGHDYERIYHWVAYHLGTEKAQLLDGAMKEWDSYKSSYYEYSDKKQIKNNGE